MAKRVASRFLRAEEQQQQQGQQQQEQQQGQQEQQAMPSGGVGKNLVKDSLEKVQQAFEGGDEAGFHSALDNLIKNSKH